MSLAGSNPALSAVSVLPKELIGDSSVAGGCTGVASHLLFREVLVSFSLVVLDGELAVPSRLWPRPKSAYAGSNSPTEGLKV